MSNYQRVFFNHYKVSSQAGFVNAVCDFVGENYTKREIKDMIEDFPTTYPCEIYIDSRIFEQSRIFIHSPDGNVRSK